MRRPRRVPPQRPERWEARWTMAGVLTGFWLVFCAVVWVATKFWLPAPLCGWLAWRAVSARVTVTPAEVVVRGLLRTRRIAVADIASVEKERSLWGRFFFSTVVRRPSYRLRIRPRRGLSFCPLALHWPEDGEAWESGIAKTVGALTWLTGRSRPDRRTEDGGR